MIFPFVPWPESSIFRSLNLSLTKHALPASQITAYTLLSDSTSTQSSILPKYRPQTFTMGQNNPAITNPEIPPPAPASYYDPYPAFGAQNHDTPQQRLQQDTHRRLPVQQNDKSGEIAIPISLLGRYQAPVECPACSRRTVTVVKHKNGKGTHTWAGILFVTTFIGGVVPYTMDYFKNVQHRCGRCGVVLATNHFGSGTEAHVHWVWHTVRFSRFLGVKADEQEWHIKSIIPGDNIWVSVEVNAMH